MLNPLSDSPQIQSLQAQSPQAQSPQAPGQQITGQQITGQQGGGQQGGGKSGAEEKGGGSRATGVDIEPRNRIGQLELSKYSTVVLYNPTELSGDEADKLLSWVEAGGGLLVVLGQEAKVERPMNPGEKTGVGGSGGGVAG